MGEKALCPAPDAGQRTTSQRPTSPAWGVVGLGLPGRPRPAGMIGCILRLQRLSGKKGPASCAFISRSHESRG